MPTSSLTKRPLAGNISCRIIALFYSRTLVSLIFVSVLVATLTAGLWPFHAPLNDARWFESDSAIQFDQEGTAFSAGTLRVGNAASGPCTFELWLKPDRIWTGGTVIDFYNWERRREFAVSQNGPELLLRKINRGRRGVRHESVLRVREVFRRHQVLLTVTSDGKKTAVYIDGELAQDAPDFDVSSEELSGQMILGNAPRREDAWAGEIKGIAVYATGLNAAEVRQHFTEWSTAGQPTVAGTQAVAIYLFREQWQKLIPNAVSGGAALVVPKRFQTMDQVRFESAISESHFDDSYRNDAIENVLGFVPLGVVAAWFWSLFVRRKAALFVAILTGVATSFIIEYFQSYLPTRYSGTTDLITNSLGTCLGVVAYFGLAWLIAKKIGLSMRMLNPSREGYRQVSRHHG